VKNQFSSSFKANSNLDEYKANVEQYPFLVIKPFLKLFL
jgi:hypothetical protein